MPYVVEVDQSGKKVEKTNTDTALAFSDGEEGAVLITAKVKRQCLETLRKADRKVQIFVLQIFSAGLFLLLKDYLDRLQMIIIDEEYPGREGDIKGMLLNLIRKERPGFPKEAIVFQQVGRKSGAHYKAYGVYKGFQDPDRTLTAEDILTVLGKQK
jgi:hypothetical protein